MSFSNLTTPRKIDTNILKTIDLYSEPLSEVDYNITSLKQRLKDLMWNKAGIIRCEKNLIEAKNELLEMQNDFKRNRKCLNKDEYEYRNMLTAALLIVESALNRKESRGAHSRSDYPQINENGVHSSITKQNNKELLYVK